MLKQKRISSQGTLQCKVRLKTKTCNRTGILQQQPVHLQYISLNIDHTENVSSITPA